MRYATAGRIGRRRGGVRRCLSKRQALEPSMLRRGGLRETTRNRRTGVSFNVDETLIGIADGLSVTRVVPAIPRCRENRSRSQSLLPGSSIPHECALVLARVYVCTVHSSVFPRYVRACVCLCVRARQSRRVSVR